MRPSRYVGSSRWFGYGVASVGIVPLPLPWGMKLRRSVCASTASEYLCPSDRPAVESGHMPAGVVVFEQRGAIAVEFADDGNVIAPRGYEG